MPVIDLDGLRLHYQQRGTGRDVVLIHAATSNLSIWLFSNLMEVLASEFRVTAYDLRGHGASDAPRTSYTSADMANDLWKLHSALQLGPAILVGHSFGGVIAMHAALRHAELVRGVLLYDSFFPGLANLEPHLHDMGNWREVREALAGAGISLSEAPDFTSLFSIAASLSPAQKQQLSEMMGESFLRWLLPLARLAPTSCGRDIFEPAGLTAERIRQISQPVVALYDEHTSFRATREFLATNLKAVQVDAVPQARHVAPLQNAGAFVELVHKHCRALDGELVQ
jgi:pimeloyl-ACP methyl ester carboxylesterase